MCVPPPPQPRGLCRSYNSTVWGGGCCNFPLLPNLPPRRISFPLGCWGWGNICQGEAPGAKPRPQARGGAPKTREPEVPPPPQTPGAGSPASKHLGEPRPQKTVTQPQAPDGRKPRPQTPGSRKPRPGSPVRAPPPNPWPTPSHLRAGSPAPKALQAGSPTPKHAARPQTPGRRKPRLAGSPAYPSSPSPAPASPRRALSPSVPPPGRCPCGGWGGGGRGSACGTRNPQREGEPQQRHSAVPPPPVPYEAPPPAPPSPLARCAPRNGAAARGRPERGATGRSRGTAAPGRTPPPPARRNPGRSTGPAAAFLPRPAAAPGGTGKARRFRPQRLPLRDRSRPRRARW